MGNHNRKDYKRKRNERARRIIKTERDLEKRKEAACRQDEVRQENNESNEVEKEK
jgi:hypothetical protein